jgi:hypothetical protein
VDKDVACNYVSTQVKVNQSETGSPSQGEISTEVGQQVPALIFIAEHTI